MNKLTKFFIGLFLTLSLVGVVYAVQTGLTGIEQEQFFSYIRHIELPANAATVGVTAPTAETNGVSRGWGFDANTEEVFLLWEIGEDWDEITDYTLEILWSGEDGDDILDGETVKFGVEYTALATADDMADTHETELQTFTQSGNQTFSELNKTNILIRRDGVNQDLDIDDIVFLKFYRDADNDTYSGKAIVYGWEVKFYANKLPYH